MLHFQPHIHGCMGRNGGVMAETTSPLPDDPRPLRPVEPDAADCCGEGCVRCVFDIYEQKVERYEKALAQWQARHPNA